MGRCPVFVSSVADDNQSRLGSDIVLALLNKNKQKTLLFTCVTHINF